MRKVERSGRRYMSDSSIRTKPSIDDPSNMMAPSSAAANWRSGISTFLMTPRMSVNCRRMNLTFMRSASSRIFAFLSAEAGSMTGVVGSATGSPRGQRYTASAGISSLVRARANRLARAFVSTDGSHSAGPQHSPASDRLTPRGRGVSRRAQEASYEIREADCRSGRRGGGRGRRRVRVRARGPGPVATA